MRKCVLLAISLAYLGGYPIFVSAQDNVTVVMNDGRERSNSISGVILSAEDNEPLVGAQVRIVGANVATITDVNGRFTFQTVALKNQKLMVSYIGMESQSVDAGHNMKIVLKPDSKTLSDVVVNGSSHVRNKHLPVPQGQLQVMRFSRLPLITSCRPLRLWILR